MDFQKSVNLDKIREYLCEWRLEFEKHYCTDVTESKIG